MYTFLFAFRHFWFVFVFVSPLRGRLFVASLLLEREFRKRSLSEHVLLSKTKLKNNRLQIRIPLHLGCCGPKGMLPKVFPS